MSRRPTTAAGSSSPPNPCCPIAFHQALKADPARWLAETHHIGIQLLDDEPVLEMRNCNRCPSTLAMNIAKPGVL